MKCQYCGQMLWRPADECICRQTFNRWGVEGGPKKSLFAKARASYFVSEKRNHKIKKEKLK